MFTSMININITLTTQGLTISLTTQFRATSEGNMLVNVIQCRTQMQYAHFTLEPGFLIYSILFHLKAPYFQSMTLF